METSGSTGADDAEAGSGPPPPLDPPGEPSPGPAATGPLPYTTAPPTPPRPGTAATTAPPPAKEHGGFGLTSGDWPTQATNVVVDLVGTVRDKTTGPITTIARGIVFGLFAGVVGLIVTVMFLIAAIRLLDEALPSGVWLPYLILGVLFVIAGALVFRKRKVPTP
jgi:hypothetical protein